MKNRPGDSAASGESQAVDLRHGSLFHEETVDVVVSLPLEDKPALQAGISDTKCAISANSIARLNNADAVNGPFLLELDDIN